MKSSTMIQSSALRTTAQIHGSSPVAELVRSKDWSATPLGPIESWPRLLLDTVNLVLSTPLPMQVYWGPHFFTIYNDGLIPALAEKHPAALGRPGEAIWAEVWPTIGEQVARVCDSGVAETYEQIPLSLIRNGLTEDTFWNYTFTPIFSRDGSVAGVLTLAQEVTESILNAQQRQAAERDKDQIATHLAQVLEATTDAVFNLDREWKFTYLNSNARRLLASYGELIGRNLWEAFPDTLYEESPFIREYHRSMDEGLPGEFETFYPEPEGWFQVISRPAANGITVFFRDTTATKQAATALIQSEKLAIVGRLAASIAHEINNPLEAVTNLLYLVRSSGDVAEIHSYIDTAERELKRVSLIANQTLRFHKQSTKKSPTICYDLIGDSLAMFQGRIVNNQIIVEKRKRAEHPVHCFDSEIRQVLNNLIGNAIDAMPSGGRLLLRSREATNHKTGKRGLVLTVADTGVGMAPEVKDRVFDAFYTTKGMGGTGLGLWISCEIVTRHNGTLRFRSCAAPRNSGTVFNVFLPFED